MRRIIPIERRILALYERRDPDECWPWLGKINDAGYGLIWGGRENPRELRAHRVMFKIHGGITIPEGMVVDHLCGIRRCVNPAHLELTTRGENVNRSPFTNANKTHCKRGHPFTSENTYVKRNGQRNCRTCHRIHTAAIRREGRYVGLAEI